MKMLSDELNSFFYEKSNETNYSWEVIRGVFLDYLEEKKRKNEPLPKIVHLSYYEMNDDEKSVAKASLNGLNLENVLTFSEVLSCKKIAENNGLLVFESDEEAAKEGAFVSLIFTASNAAPNGEDFV